jgi:hypothetical protein
MHPFLTRYRNLLLLAVLLGLLLAAWERPDTLTGRVFWLADVGLFLLWQPMVDAERRLRPIQIGLTFGVLLAFAMQMSWAGLAVWAAFLTALVGGKVVLARGVRLRWFFLLAFAFLSFILFAWISPQVVVEPTAHPAAPDLWVRWTAVVALAVLLALMPLHADEDRAAVYDLLVSFIILMVISVILMRTHTLVAVHHLSHLEAVAQALLSFGLLLLLVSWAWYPRLGFSGIGAVVSRYLFRLGFPFDQWLNRLTELSDQEPEPQLFLQRAAVSFLDLPWVVGGRWVVGGQAGQFGNEDRHLIELRSAEVEVVLFATHRWSAALVWQANLLFRLVAEFFRAKQRDRLLQKMRYLQAVHETGSRLTHDVKNLLQSLDSLCFALEHVDSQPAEELTGLLRRQLPVVTQRLRSTLGKLSRPSEAEEAALDLVEWWNGLQQRYQGQGISFSTLSPMGAWLVPQQVFDNVADNLLGNSLQKRATGEVRISVELEFARERLILAVSDDGQPFPREVAAGMFGAPVPSATGLGIGLYHASELAKTAGYDLRLIDNRAGSVRVELAGPLLRAAA